MRGLGPANAKKLVSVPDITFSCVESGPVEESGVREDLLDAIPDEVNGDLYSAMVDLIRAAYEANKLIDFFDSIDSGVNLHLESPLEPTKKEWEAEPHPSESGSPEKKSLMELVLAAKDSFTQSVKTKFQKIVPRFQKKCPAEKDENVVREHKLHFEWSAHYSKLSESASEDLSDDDDEVCLVKEIKLEDKTWKEKLNSRTLGIRNQIAGMKKSASEILLPSA